MKQLVGIDVLPLASACAFTFKFFFSIETNPSSGRYIYYDT